MKNELNNKSSFKKAVIYLRVSTEEQVDNFSLGTQEEICSKEAQRRNYEIVKVFREEGKSAKTITGRPVLIELLEFCRKNKKIVDALIVYRLDRLSRQTADYLAIRKKLAEYDIALISTSEPTGTTPADKFVELMLAGVAQMDNDVRSERTKNGMRARFLSGLHTGVVPLGYLNKDGYVIKDPKSFDKVKQAWDLMATGSKGLREIANLMNSWGLRQTLKGKEYPLRNQTVSRLFKNKFYCGILTSSCYPEEVKGQHIPMITVEQYYRVQSVIDGRNTNIKVPLARKNPDNPDFPLRRIVKCSKCGGVFTGAWSKGKRVKYAYYFCRQRCVTTSVAVDTMETEMIEGLRRITPTKEQLELFISLVRKIYYKRIANLQKKRQSAEQEIKRLTELRQSLIEKNLAGIYSDEIFKEQNKVLEEKIEVAQMAKEDSLVSKYNLEAIITFIREKFTDLGKTYQEEKSLSIKRVLLCSIYPSGVHWMYPGISNTEISLYYQYIRDINTASAAFGDPKGI